MYLHYFTEFHLPLEILDQNFVSIVVVHGLYGNSYCSESMSYDISLFLTLRISVKMCDYENKDLFPRAKFFWNFS